MQTNIISWTEKWQREQSEFPMYSVEPDALGEHYAPAQSAVVLAEGADAGAIVVVETGAGELTRALAAVRPDVPVVAICSSLKVCRQLIISRGVYPVHAPDGGDAVKLARDAGFAPKDEALVLLEGGSMKLVA
jgi:pyruvate kinase